LDKVEMAARFAPMMVGYLLVIPGPALIIYDWAEFTRRRGAP